MATSSIATIAGIFSVVIGVLILAVCLLFLVRYSKKKSKSILYLTLSTFSWIGATWSATLIYLFAGWNLEPDWLKKKIGVAKTLVTPEEKG